MALKIGFICEGESDEIILQSPQFISFLEKINLELVYIQPIGGKKQMEDGRIEPYYRKVLDYGAEKVIVLKDGDKDCRDSKQKVGEFDNMIVSIAVREVENWYLADFTLLSKLNSSFELSEPPETISKPENFINNVRSKTFKGSKPALAKSVVRSGFSIENAAKNSESAKYFIKKLESLNQ